MEAARGFKPDTLVHMGDLADFYRVSFHSKDPSRTLSMKDEVLAVRALRGEMDDLGAKRKLFVEGNHESRLVRYLHDKAPELFGFISVDDLLQFTENGWEFTPYKSYAKVG